VDGADAKRFTLAGNKLTFKATAFKAQSNTYRVKIKVFQERFDRGFSPWAFPHLRSSMLVASIITLSVFSGVETLAVVIRNVGTYFPLSSGFLVTVTVRVL
jgi:hypothetical protein